MEQLTYLHQKEQELTNKLSYQQQLSQKYEENQQKINELQVQCIELKAIYSTIDAKSVQEELEIVKNLIKDEEDALCDCEKPTEITPKNTSSKR